MSRIAYNSDLARLMYNTRHIQTCSKSLQLCYNLTRELLVKVSVGLFQHYSISFVV